MRKILTLTMSGLVTVLPLALTVYVIWWLVNTVEGALRRALIALHVVSPEHYWPGLGLITGFLLLLVVGSLVNAYAGRIDFHDGDEEIARPNTDFISQGMGCRRRRRWSFRNRCSKRLVLVRALHFYAALYL